MNFSTRFCLFVLFDKFLKVMNDAKFAFEKGPSLLYETRENTTTVKRNVITNKTKLTPQRINKCPLHETHTILAIVRYSKAKQWKKRNPSSDNLDSASNVVMGDILHEYAYCVINLTQIGTVMQYTRQEIPLLFIAWKATE